MIEVSLMSGAPHLPLGGTRREQGKVERRERLYEAALALFREQGYENTTVSQITGRAGLAKGTFFNYFPTKDAVLRHMGEREVGRLGAASLAYGGASSLARLRRLLAALAHSFERDRPLIRLIFRNGISIPELLVGTAAGFSVQPTAALLIQQAQRAGELNPDLDPDTLAAALDALYLQQLVRWCESSEGYPLDERLTGMADLLLLGLSAPASNRT